MFVLLMKLIGVQGLQGNVSKSVFVLLMKLIGFYVLVAVAVVVANLPPPPPNIIQAPLSC